MNKQEILKQYGKEEDKILVAKILDKIQYASQKNQIQITDFLDGYQQKIAQKVLQQVRYQESTFYGGYEEAERKMLFLFPERLFILVREDGADILVQEEMLTYLLSNLSELTRFQKAEILAKEISEIEVVPIQLEELVILVPQLRLDVVVSELVHTSRTKAEEIIMQERVLVNYETKTKNATILQVGDLLTIRGKGKFKIGEVICQTIKGKLRVKVEKYVS